MVLGDILGDVYKRTRDRMSLSNHECADKWALEDQLKFRGAHELPICKDVVAEVLRKVKNDVLMPEMVPASPVKVFLLGRDGTAKGDVINHLLQLSIADNETGMRKKRPNELQVTSPTVVEQDVKSTFADFFRSLSITGTKKVSDYSQLEQEDFSCPEHSLTDHVSLVDAPEFSDVHVVSEWLERHKVLKEAHAAVLVVSGLQQDLYEEIEPAGLSAEGLQNGSAQDTQVNATRMLGYGQAERTLVAIFSMLGRPIYVIQTRLLRWQTEAEFRVFRSMCKEDGADDVFQWDAIVRPASEGFQASTIGKSAAEHGESSIVQLHWVVCHHLAREVFLRQVMRASLKKVFLASAPYNVSWMFFSRSFGSLVPGLNLFQTVRETLASCQRMSVTAGFIPDPATAAPKQTASKEHSQHGEKSIPGQNDPSGPEAQSATSKEAAADEGSTGTAVIQKLGADEATRPTAAGPQKQGTDDPVATVPKAHGEELEVEKKEGTVKEKDLAKAIAEAMEHGEASEQPPDENQKLAAAVAMKSTLASGAADQLADIYQWILLGAILEGGIENVAEVALGATIPLVAGTVAAATAYTQHQEMVQRFADRALLVYLRLMQECDGIIAKKARELKDACMAKVMAPDCLHLFKDNEGAVKAEAI